MGHASDQALAAAAVSVLAALWFGWTVRHSGRWSRLVPAVGGTLAGALGVVGVVIAVRAWPDGTVVTGRVVSIYVGALLAHVALTRLGTGLIASRYRRAVAAAKDEDKAGVTAGRSRIHLIPTVVAASTAIQVAVIANTLGTPDLYLAAAAGLLAAPLAWPVGLAVRTVALTHMLTGLFSGSILLGAAIWLLLQAT